MGTDLSWCVCSVPQSCPTHCDSVDCSPPGSSVPGILQVRILVPLPPPGDHLTQAWTCSCSVVSDSVTPWTAAHQAPLSMGFPRQECWSRLPFPSPGDFPDPGIEPRSSASHADSFPLSHWRSQCSFLKLQQ